MESRAAERRRAARRRIHEMHKMIAEGHAIAIQESDRWPEPYEDR